MKRKHLLLLWLFTFTVMFSFAQPAGWSYSYGYIITEQSGSQITGYQLRMVVNTSDLVSAGKMLPDGNDIRFGKNIAGTVLYPYWIESGINTATTVIWVKIDTLFASASRDLFMFYGNPLASPVSAVDGTFNGPNSSTDSVASGGAGGATNSQRGFRFSTTEELLVTHFGKREPNGSTRYVTLFDFTSQAILRQIQVSGPAAQYNYGALSNPIWLTPGAQYLLELHQGGSDGYYFGTSSQVGQHLVYGDMRYCNGCDQNTFPTSVLSNYQYGYPDLWYYTKTNVSPAPTYELNVSSISGVALYDNNPQTPLDGLQITLKRNNAPVGSPVTTGPTGSYLFTGLSSGTYDLEIRSAAPGGVWQTWGGVNNTDYLLVSRHAAGISFLPLNPPVVRVAADVKSPQTPPVINSVDANSIRMAAKYGWGSPTPWFDTEKWVFTGTTESLLLTGIVLSGGAVVRDIRGLCAGDVNGSYIPPSGNKQAVASVELLPEGKVAMDDEIIIPIRTTSNLETGAITLFLNYDAAMVEITGVTMPFRGDEEPYFIAKNNILHLGWASLVPIQAPAGSVLMAIHARVKSAKTDKITLTLNNKRENEIADAVGSVISPARLTIADAVQGGKAEALLTVYPNPAREVVNIGFIMKNDGTFKAELFDLRGIRITGTESSKESGTYLELLKVAQVRDGVYMLRVSCGDETTTRKIVIQR